MFVEIGKMFAVDFEKNNVGFCKGLPAAKVAMSILESCYNIFLYQKKIKKIEDLPENEKQIIWETAKELSNGRLQNNEQMKTLCRALYSLEYLLSIKK